MIFVRKPVPTFRDHARLPGPGPRLGLPNPCRQAMPGEPGHKSDGMTVRALPQGWWIGGRVLAKPACCRARHIGMSLRPRGAADGACGSLQPNHLIECRADDHCANLRTDARL